MTQHKIDYAPVLSALHADGMVSLSVSPVLSCFTEIRSDYR